MNHSTSRWASLLSLAVLAVPLLHACGTENGLVGGECRAGYTQCGSTCVDLTSDEANCGTCDNVCVAGVTCGGGVCGGSVDASRDGSDDGSRDGSEDGAPPPDDGGSDGDSGSGLPDGDTDPDADAGESADACVPPFDSPAHCGACAVACPVDTPICRASEDGGFACAPVCETPLVNCDGTCVDTAGNDPYHCGACNRFCPSFLCVAGVCQGVTPGEVVVIGHDYSGAVANTSQTRLLLNAVSIATRTPIRVLSYEQNAPADTVAHVKALLGSSPRPLVFTASNTPADLQSATLAASYDVVLVYDQANADSGTASAIGDGAKTALHDFAAVGGVIVALDGNGGQGHMPELLTAAQLLDVSAHTTIPNGTPVFVSRVGDLVTSGVTNTYGAAARTVSFTTSEADVDPVRWVVRAGPQNALGEPIVVRKTISP